MRTLSVCILGGTGFVGTRLCSRLIRAGHRVTVLSRDREQHRALRVLPGLAVENCDVYDAAQLSERFRGHDVVVNLIGILNESGFGGGGFRRAHIELTRGALQAARSAGVERVLQMSALKASTDGPSHYLRSKGEAERIVRTESAGLDWTIFQPSVIFGPGDSFLNRFADLLGKMPLIFPLARPDARFQPVHVDDVTEAMLRCLHGGAASRRTYELGGPERYSLREIVEFVARVTGRRHWVIGLPDVFARMQAAAMDFVPGRPFSTDNYRSLGVDNVCDRDGLAELGIVPQAMQGAASLYLGPLAPSSRLSRMRTAAAIAEDEEA
jgi:NADH dehydrogenase